jgi:ATP-dependent DNA helicase RecQ
VTEDLRRVAEQTFGWQQLRDEQLEAMTHVLAGRDVLVVLPTGAGKSAIYQTPTVLLDGPAVVVSPLIALQLRTARRRAGAGVAGAAHGRGPVRLPVVGATGQAGRGRRARRAGRDALRGGRGALHLVVGTRLPARLAPPRAVIERLGHPPVLALTATAAPPVRDDIAERLGLRDPAQVVAGFDRPNLHLTVQRFTEDADKRNAVTAQVRTLTSGPATRCGLVYTASRKDAESHAEQLARVGVHAAPTAPTPGTPAGGTCRCRTGPPPGRRPTCARWTSTTRRWQR